MMMQVIAPEVRGKRLTEKSKPVRPVAQPWMWLLVIKIPAVGNEHSVHRGYHATICKTRVSLIAGLDFPLEHGTGTWDWNVGLDLTD